MKTINRYVLVTLLLGAALAAGCGSSTTSSSGGTETGTTTTGTIDTTELATRINSVASALVPDITNSSGNASVSAGKSITYGASDQWSLYTDTDNNYVLTDIFGSADVDPRVVTKIRVLLDQLSSTVSDIFTQDPSITCANATALNEGDTISIAFYGDLSNGTSTDRHFSCISADSNATTIYGRDSSGIVRIVTMSDTTSTNTEDVATRGDEVRIRSVISTTYAEQTETESTVSYLDLNFAHSTVYNGVDSIFDNSDDVLFKSRSRITGRAVLDANGTPSLGTGDFTVTKYDYTGSGSAIVTKALGRGSYGSSDNILFKIDSNVSALASDPGTFCIQVPSGGSGLPTLDASSDCSTLETALAWGTSTFPYTLSPSIDADFETKVFFEGDNTDMVANDGSNFTIPTYN